MLCQVLAEKSDIIVLAENWLWPFELAKLNSIVSGFQGTGTSDARLHEELILKRGCEGVEIIWKRSIIVSNVVSIDSDRKIIAIQVSTSL